MENYIVDNQANDSVSVDDILQTFNKIQELQGSIDFETVDSKISNLINEMHKFMRYFQYINVLQEQLKDSYQNDALLIAQFITDKALTEDFMAYLTEQRKA